MRAWTVCVVVAAMLGQGACAEGGAHVSAPLGSREASWRYDVVATERATDLHVEAWLPRGSLADLVVRPGAENFVAEVQIKEKDGWRDVPRRGVALHVPECSRGCHLRYRFALMAAAQALHDTDMAIAWGDVVEAPPSMWLLHPALAPARARYRFRVRTAPGTSFATGVFASEEDRGQNAYEADASDIGAAPYAAFGPLRVIGVEAATGATLDVAIAPGNYQASDDTLVAWVATSARTMARFFGCFPLEHVMVLVVPAHGDRVRRGETMGDGGASIVVEVGERTDAAALAADWVLPHEMAHLAVPSVPRRHHWLEEGIAVYVQPIARARAGQLTAAQVWREFANGMPKGVPTRGDRGLDDTPDWARTYWGGATYCMLTDLEIRRRTGNRLGFEDALRGVLASGGSIARTWGFERLIDAADASVGAPAFRLMHDAMGGGPWTVDLPHIFSDLGVVVHGDDVTLSDDAPLAAMRRSITEPLPTDSPEPAACRYGSPGRIAQR